MIYDRHCFIFALFCCVPISILFIARSARSSCVLWWDSSWNECYWSNLHKLEYSFREKRTFAVAMPLSSASTIICRHRCVASFDATSVVSILSSNFCVFNPNAADDDRRRVDVECNEDFCLFRERNMLSIAAAGWNFMRQ